MVQFLPAIKNLFSVGGGKFALPAIGAAGLKMPSIGMPNMSIGGMPSIAMPSFGAPKGPKFDMGQMLGQGGGNDPGGLAATGQAQAAGMVSGSTPVPVFSDLVNQEYAPEMYDTPENIDYAGALDPALQGQSEMQNIQIDPNVKNAQMNALQGLTDIYSQGGMSAIDRARLAEIQSAQQSVDRGQREAILQSQAMRGMGASGNTLAALLQGQQGSANAANMQALDVNAQAQQRALEAMMNAGQFGTQLNTQQFGQQAQQAQAQDAISRFNMENQNAARERNLGVRQGLIATNTGARNAARQGNTDLRNQAMGQNVDLRNQANYYNRVTRPTTVFGMQSGNNQLIGQGLQNAANMANQNRWNQQAINQQDRGAAIGSIGSITQGVAGAFGGGGGMGAGIPGLPGMGGANGAKLPNTGKLPFGTGSNPFAAFGMGGK